MCPLEDTNRFPSYTITHTESSLRSTVKSRSYDNFTSPYLEYQTQLLHYAATLQSHVRTSRASFEILTGSIAGRRLERWRARRWREVDDVEWSLRVDLTAIDVTSFSTAEVADQRERSVSRWSRSISSNSAAQYAIKRNWDGRERSVFRYEEVTFVLIRRAMVLRHK